jgi:predicted esterase
LTSRSNRSTPTNRRNRSIRRLEKRVIRVERSARYYTLGSTTGARQVWIACHGYGQLAAIFGRHFEGIAGDQLLVVVPEGLSRFYLDHADGTYERVGASWMTRDERESEIADQVAYLDAVLSETMRGLDDSPRIVGFGFSQGGATITRWIDRSPLLAERAQHVDRLILWGSAPPEDLDLTDSWLKKADLTLVVGTEDSYATPERMAGHEALLVDANIPFKRVNYSGGHRIIPKVLSSLANTPLQPVAT